MKVLFAIRSIYQFSYVDSIVKYLDQRGHSITVLFDKGWSRNHSPRFVEDYLSKRNDTHRGWSLRRQDTWRRLIFALREVRSYAGYLRRTDQSKYYRMRWKRYLPKSLKKNADSPVIRRLLSSDMVFRWITRCEKWVPPDGRIVESLLQSKPDVVVVSPMIQRFSEEVEYAKAAMMIGIPTVVPAYSWDVLTTKGLFHVIPDFFLAWNRTQHTEAKHIHGIQDQHVLITGSPFFDKWFEAGKLREARSRFCRRVGLNPDKPYLLYLGSSKNIAQDETWLIRELLDKINTSPDPRIRELRLLVRPHPANTEHYARLTDRGAVIWPKEGALPQAQDTQRDFYNSVAHCALTAGINTSGMIDAIIIGKPCLTIMTPRYRRTQEQAVHFKYLLDADVLEVTQSADEAIMRIGHVLNGQDRLASQRQQFIRDFARPLGVGTPAGKIAAVAIELAACGKKIEEIRTEMGSSALTAARSAERTALESQLGNL